MICGNKECGKEIKGKKYTLIEEGKKIYFHPICFQKVVIGVKPDTEVDVNK